jgi:anti-sigma regulatory factor (Ser/Thr protein kinase)
VTGQAAGAAWPSAVPPQASDQLSWRLSDVADLPRVRSEVRRFAVGQDAEPDREAADLHDRLVLALDEMASNALRHGGGGGVCATLRSTDDDWLIDVTDCAHDRPPAPAVGRDPSEGGLGLYLIAELATQHGWYAEQGCKHVWALIPRR